jgi:hypothetical protein
MVREVRNILHDMNIDSEKVFFEQY